MARATSITNTFFYGDYKSKLAEAESQIPFEDVYNEANQLVESGKLLGAKQEFETIPSFYDVREKINITTKAISDRDNRNADALSTKLKADGKCEYSCKISGTENMVHQKFGESTLVAVVENSNKPYEKCNSWGRDRWGMRCDSRSTEFFGTAVTFGLIGEDSSVAWTKNVDPVSMCAHAGWYSDITACPIASVRLSEESPEQILVEIALKGYSSDFSGNGGNPAPPGGIVMVLAPTESGLTDVAPDAINGKVLTFLSSIYVRARDGYFDMGTFNLENSSGFTAGSSLPMPTYLWDNDQFKKDENIMIVMDGSSFDDLKQQGWVELFDSGAQSSLGNSSGSDSTNIAPPPETNSPQNTDNGTSATYYVMKPDKSGICVRSSADSSDQCRMDGQHSGTNIILLITKDNAGTKLEYLNETVQGSGFDWYKVKIPDGSVGYVRTDAVQVG